ncbi:4 histone acetyltransferase complex component yng2 [Pyrrhoderma noxium]|uniref:Chromatin modification-related protein n=1 Tax=Pyrrhoderma noxium TaxID=2282107 RepID=A0A286UN77_9AGAM|nr:4 histone acetyltransferase complex component yng2 [Pyrrhoderma noxium]
MSSISAANHEEAAQLAAEFISSLDNLPNEVQYLLAEIRHKETRAQEIQAEIQKDTNRYIRHALKSSNSNNNNNSSNNNTNTNGNASSKDALIPGRVAAAYTELEQLANEKVSIAAQLVSALTRVNARLEHDLARVVQLSGEVPQEQYEVRGGYVVGPLAPTSAGVSAGVNGTGAGGAVGGATGAGLGSMSSMSNVLGGVGVGGSGMYPSGGNAMAARSVREVQETLRASITNELAAVAAASSTATSASAAVHSGSGQGSQKRRRLNTSGVVASASIGASRAHTPQGRSRLNAAHASPSPMPAVTGSRGGGGGAGGRRGITPAAAAAATVLVGDEDADGDQDADADGEVEDPEESGDAEDKELYCYCQKMSYGEMIGCDNDSCPYQWFHLGCVGLKAPLPDHWYCDECLKSLGGGGGGRKGRRK